MVRGRRENPSANPSRQLEISRAFRNRRALLIVDLKAKVHQLETDNTFLRARLDECTKSMSHLRQGANPSSWSCIEEIAYSTRFPSSLLVAYETTSACQECTRIKLEMRNFLHALNDASQVVNSLICPESLAGQPKVVASNETRTPPHSRVNDQERAPFEYGGNAPEKGNLSLSVTDKNRATELDSTKENHLTQQQWDQALTELGGDAGKCCAGFFDCGVEEDIATEAK